MGGVLATAACGGTGTTGGSPSASTRLQTSSPPPVSSTTSTTQTATTPTTATTPRPAESLRITSSAFGNGARIPATYSCHGANQSPPLTWRGVPDGTVELALVLDDPDAVGGTFVHWVVVGIGPDTSGTGTGRVPAGGTVLPNSNGDARYLGPCPPSGTGTHHYRFTLYALGTHLRLAANTAAARAKALIVGAASASARLVGRYSG